MKDKQQTDKPMSQDKPAMQGTTKPENQGEGDRRSAKKYNEEQHRFAESGKVEPAAREAEKAFQGREGDELRRAEEKGKARMAEEDPQLKKGSKKSA